MNGVGRIVEMVGEKLGENSEIYDKKVLGIIGEFLMEEEKLVRKRKGWLMRELKELRVKKCEYQYGDVRRDIRPSLNIRPSLIKIMVWGNHYVKFREILKKISPYQWVIHGFKIMKKEYGRTMDRRILYE
jgi:hypothetical protein